MSRPRAESWSTAADETGEEDGDIDPYVLGENNVLGMTADEQRSLLHSLSSSLVGNAEAEFYDSADLSDNDDGGEISPIEGGENGHGHISTIELVELLGKQAPSSRSSSASSSSPDRHPKLLAVGEADAAAAVFVGNTTVPTSSPAPVRRQRQQSTSSGAGSYGDSVSGDGGHSHSHSHAHAHSHAHSHDGVHSHSHSHGGSHTSVGHDLRVLDPYGQVDRIPFHRVVTDSSAKGYDDAEAETSRSFLQVLRLRRRYLDASKQTVPSHLGSVVGEIKRIRRATLSEHDSETSLGGGGGGGGAQASSRNWGRAGMSPMSTPTRPSSAEPSFHANPVPLHPAARSDSRESTGSSKEDAVFASSASPSPATPPSEYDAARGGGIAGAANAPGMSTGGGGCYNLSCSKRTGIPSAYKCYSPNCRQSKFKFIIEEGVFNVVTTSAPSMSAPRVSARASAPGSASHADQQQQQQHQQHSHGLSMHSALFQYVHVDVYLREVKMLQALVMDGPSKSIAYRRIQILKKQFELHTSLNETLERTEQTAVPHRDFYNVRKVDTHIHLSACMNQKHLLRFIKKKLRVEGETVVLTRDGEDMTLTEVFKSMDMTAYDLSIDALDLHAGQHCFHRFDRFNTKYNPIGSSALREIFLKTNNKIKGRYYAEVCKEVFDDLEESKYQQAEYRVSIYGRNRDEWDGLANWFVDYDMSSPHVRWLIQTPRLYHIYISNGMVGSFQDMLDNFFRPLFEASACPTDHPKLARFLEEVVGFDSVDDESKPEYSQHSMSSPTPGEWTGTDNPPYSYYIYYWYANMSVLNQFRKKQGLNTFVLRPHAGEAGSTDHLISTYLCAEGISHGIQLRKAPVLQYLYYLAQIPMAMSPLSNNALFLEYTRNPFQQFFDQGLFVSLSTDDPLQFHMTKEPLIEEYAVASQVWRFSATDQAELCANSVRMSGFESSTKSKWIGENWRLPGPLGNDIKVTNVPSVRLAYRYEALLSELQLLLTRSRL